VVYDSPYKKLFGDYNFSYLSGARNVVIAESFSKWIGLPGLRLGFIHCYNEDFNRELNIRLLYEFNGVSSPSQVIIDRLLSTPEGKKAIDDFKKVTTEHIARNIDYLKENGLLANDIYQGATPLGIFAIVNKSEDFLFQKNIGSVGLDKFTYYDRDLYSSYARICVSVPHSSFKEYIDKIL
jgi:aspartate/methionine/tyrosine aminotransferase